MGAPLRYFTLPFLVFAWSCCASAQPTDLVDIANDHQLAGLSVVTRCHGELSIDVHTGFRDIGRKLPVNEETTFRIASISKACVALLTAKLADEGTLDYDAPLSSYLDTPPVHPEHPNVALTVQHLLTHTSGIRDGAGYGGFLSASYNAAPNVPPLQDALQPGGQFYTADMWGAQAPGTWFQYANLNFGVLATVLEAATGSRFDALFQTWLAAPYGLDGGFTVQDLDDIDDLAVLYRQIDGQWTAQADELLGIVPAGPDWTEYYPGTNALAFAPQGGLRISGRDLSILAQLWSSGTAQAINGTPLQLLSDNALEALKAVQWAYDDAGSGNGNNYYGLFNAWSHGLHLASSGLGADQVIPDVAITPFHGHPGEAYGLISDAYATPNGEWNFVMLTNGKWSGYSPGETSAFYAVEEAVFSALRSDLLQCLAQDTPTLEDAQGQWMAAPVRLGDTTLRLSIPLTKPSPHQFTIYDGTGKRMAGGRLDGPVQGEVQIPIPVLPAGWYAGALTGTTTSAAHRFLFWVTP